MIVCPPIRGHADCCRPCWARPWLPPWCWGFGQYANALTYDADGIVFGLSNQNGEYTARLMAAMALTTLVLVLPLVFLARRWFLPPGTATLLFTVTGALSAAVTGFTNLPVILAVLAAGVGTDLLARRLQPGPGRRAATRAVAALAPLLTWAAFIAVARLTASGAAGPADLLIRRDATLELSLGAPMVQALIGLLAAELLFLDQEHRPLAPPQGAAARR